MQGDILSYSNQDWFDAMQGRGAQSAAILRELEVYLQRTLGKVVGPKLSDDDLVEAVQETLTRVTQNLDSFRGDSAFTTWAAGIATRVAFTEIRRRQASRIHAGAFEQIQEDLRQPACPGTSSPDEIVARSQLLSTLHDAIATHLTERQQTAILAELRGIPTIEIAEKLGTNQNALYKLTHDARKKLRKVLVKAGFTEESIVKESKDLYS